MKVLLDACVWGGAAAVLTDAGYDIDAVIDWGADPGDQVILSRALEVSRIIVTLDKDFGELAIVHKLHTTASSGSLESARRGRAR